MGRSKSIPDVDVLDALLELVLTVGPAGLSFARAAQAVGLSPATLVQRFGTRDAMLRATLIHAWDELDAATDAADLAAPHSPEGAIQLLLELMAQGDPERNATDGLLLLREDIRDPVLRARGAAWGHRLALALGHRLTDSAADAERLGWQMATVWMGAQTWWAFTRSAPAEVAVRTALDEWLHAMR